MAEREYRGKHACIFGNNGETPGEFCAWNDAMFKKLVGNPSTIPDQYDRLELCKLCTSQNEMKALSSIGSMLKRSNSDKSL